MNDAEMRDAARRAIDAIYERGGLDGSFAPLSFDGEAALLMRASTLPQSAAVSSVEMRKFEHPEEGPTMAVGAYDTEGMLAGILRGGVGGVNDGIFKIVVRENARRQGIGTRLLDAAQRAGCDILGNVTRNAYTEDGMLLLQAWLQDRANR